MRENNLDAIHKRLLDIINPGAKVIESLHKPQSSIRRQYRRENDVMIFEY